MAEKQPFFKEKLRDSPRTSSSERVSNDESTSSVANPALVKAFAGVLILSDFTWMAVAGRLCVARVLTHARRRPHL
jgi:hypothetical protein